MTPQTTRSLQGKLAAIIDWLTEIPGPETIYGPAPAPTGTPVAGSPDPGRLPYGLDRITDDPETGAIRSRSGICELLWDVADEWADNRIGASRPPADPTDPAVARWLYDHTPTAYAHLLPEVWQIHASIIAEAYRHVARLTGHTTVKVDASCPRCGRSMHRYATSAGLSDIVACPSCGPFTRAEYAAALAALAEAGHLPPGFLVTVEEAASFLGIPYQTAYARMRARAAGGGQTGKQRRPGKTLYRLDAFYPLAA